MSLSERAVAPAIFSVYLAASTAFAQVTVSQDTITLKTWSEGAPDPNPWFELFPSYYYPMYPYTLRNNFLSDTTNVPWRELTVQNEYLFCRVFPDLGGHLYSCLDKINNVEMFYANPVIRKGYVGLRGAWAALGIELNFPVGHSLVSVSPISSGTQRHADGSAGVWVADIDRQTGMEWRVEFVLRPGSTMLEQNVWMYNRSDVRQPYYWWSDAQEKIADQNDTFIYPTHLIAQHGFAFIDTWPVSQTGITSQPGVDLSVIKNYTNGWGLFAYGSNEPFFAAYHPSLKTATVHYADTVAMPGKKLWTWGPSPQFGDAWVTANLTENFSSYIETQAGVTPNQETRLWLEPQQVKHFTEYWMPARDLDGISRASTSGVLYLGRTTSNGQTFLEAEFNANRSIQRANVKILNGGSIVFQEPAPVDLVPTTTYKRTVPISDTNPQYTLQLLDNSGNVLLTHTENQYSGQTASDVTLGAQPAPNLNAAGSEQDFLFRSGYHEQYRQYSLAEVDYNMGLQLFPSSVALRKGLGRLAYLSARYDDAATLLAQVTAQTPSDHEAHFYLGLAYAALGRGTAAAAEWSGIESTADFGQAASYERGVLDAASGDLAAAVTVLDGVSTVRAAAMEIATLRHQGNTAKRSALLARWLASNPTDLFLRYEASLTTPDATLMSDLGAEPERILNLTDDYMRVGFYSDALVLLNQTYPQVPANQREPGSVTPQNNALVAYYRGYCKQQMGLAFGADFAAASGMALPYLFPNRASSFPVLRAAIRANASDATAHDLLGLLYMNMRQGDNAIAEWQTARALNKNLPTLDRNLGRAYLDLKSDPASALPVLSEGRTIEPSNSDLQDAFNRATTASQAYSSSCPFSITGAANASTAAGPSLVTIAFTVSTSNCAWAAPPYLGWVTSTTAASGTGNGSITYAIAANNGLTSRTANLTIAGKAFTITQAGASCAYTLTSSKSSAPAGRSTLTVGVNSPSDACSWSASPRSDWIAVLSQSGGTVTLSISPNNGPARSGAVTIGGVDLTVDQAAAQHVAGDFDGNRIPDRVWQNDITGQVTVHYYGGPSGAVFQNWNWLDPNGVRGWHVVAIADFNGDGVPDLVWQEDATRRVTIYYFGGPGGAVFQGWTFLNFNGSPGWRVVAAADFNGDGVPDLVWQNDDTKQVAVNYYGGSGGATFQGWNWLNSVGVPGWTVRAAADFNGDGVPDLVWQSDSTRQVVINYYGGPGGTVFQSWDWLDRTGVLGWSVRAAVDVNFDGVPDLIWQNDTTRQVTVYYYGGQGGAVYQRWNWLHSSPEPGWSVIG